MESNNSFNKGMDLDINPLNLPKGKYKEANNIRIINDVGSTSFSVNNIKGTLEDLTIPDLPIFQNITIVADTVGSTESLTINGETGLSFDTSGMTPEDLYNYIVDSGNYTLLGTEYNLYYSNSYLLVVPVTGSTLTMSEVGGGLSMDSTFIPAQTNLEVIGSVDIRGDIYLFTTNCNDQNPGGHDSTLTTDASSVGQIWKYVYDKITLAGTLTLIYNNYVDFSTYYTITPTAVTGRYENAGIQRIYWTDNFNKLRSLNVADDNSLAIDVSILDVQPAVDLDKPILTDIGNSSLSTLKVGVYQAAYRFKNTGGAVTNFSALSDLVYLTSIIDEHASINGDYFKDYTGSAAGTAAGKQMTWTISNFDADYDRFEVAILFKASINDVPTITLIEDEPVDSTSITIVYDGTNDSTPMTLAEFRTLSGAFTHCKTIGTKDNRLFAANIRNQMSEIDYDARAFRAFTPGASDIKLTDGATSTTYATVASAASGASETSDAINDYSDPTLSCKYKPGAPVLGGEGINISYEFYTIAISADVDTNASGPFGVSDYVYAPWRHTNPDYTNTGIDLGVRGFSDDFTQVNQVTPTGFPNPINDGFKYPPYVSALRGFQRNEIYRFGIQFFDKTKRPTFVKWIGDIKMPDAFDSCLNSSGGYNSFYANGVATGVQDFRLSFVGNRFTASGMTGYDEAFVQTLGIQFTVNIPISLSSEIDGYSIVRVKREESDKTIISQGFVTGTDRTASNGEIYMPVASATDIAMNQNFVDGRRGFFITPDMCDGNLTSPRIGDTVTINTLLTNANTDGAIDFGGDPFWMLKYYNTLSTPEQTFLIQQFNDIGYAGEGMDGSTPVHNYDKGSNPSYTTSHSIGNPAYFFVVSPGSTGNGVDFTITGPTVHKLLATISRTLTNQYGGNTYTDRARNEYISCSHYRPIRKSAVAISDTFALYGGDIFVNMYDSARAVKNWDSTVRGVEGTKYSTTFYFPVESSVNADLRHGKYMNKDFNSSVETGSSAMIENNIYNGIYSAQCDSEVFFPKPDPFILNEEFDNRVYASEIKINGEHTDSWGIFLANNYWDVEGTYGPINAIDILKDKMYFWQTRAFGVLQINPRSVITDVNAAANAELQIGTGLPLQRHDYLSTELGLQHQWGVTKSSYKLFWLDVNNKKFFSYGEGQSITPESDVKGLFSFLNNNLVNNILTTDKPTYIDHTIGTNGIRCVYDFKYNQAIFTISDGVANGEAGGETNFSTFVYDERMDAFSSFYSHTPYVYFTDGYKIFSTNPELLNEIHIHDSGDYCNFYGNVYDSSIKIIVNDNYSYTKVFDNIMYDSQSTDVNGVNQHDDTWSIIRVYNDYQNTDFQSLTYLSNIKRKERTWQLAVPRNRVLYTASNSPDIFTDLSPTDKTMGERIRDKWIAVDLSYDNANNRNLAFNNFRTLYRSSAR